jgi:hypothetical protein
MIFICDNNGPIWLAGGDPNYASKLIIDQGIVVPGSLGSAGSPGVQSRLQAGFGGISATGNTAGNGGVNQLAFRIESRSIDKVAILSEGSMATFHSIDITTRNGFGGGIMITGAGDSSAYVDCRITGTTAGGQDLDGNPVHAVTILDGNPHFAGCMVGGNVGSEQGVIVQTGGSGFWTGCFIGSDPTSFTNANTSPVSDGIYSITGGATPQFASCTFRLNTSRFGTVYFDSTQNGDNESVLFTNCLFDQNMTVDGQWGATAYCVDAQTGRNPLIVLDRCVYDGANVNGTTQGSTRTEHDVVSNYFPRYRVLRDNTTSNFSAGVPGTAGVGNADSGDGAASIPADLNGDGVVNGADLAIVLGSWS